MGSTEVDFVAMNQDGNLYLQVAASIRDEATLARELRPLQQIRDSYPKLILTLITKYTELLKNSRNLILTGAPGTGETSGTTT